MIIEQDILTDREVASLLRVRWQIVQGLARSRELRGMKIGGRWRFEREEVHIYMARMGVK